MLASDDLERWGRPDPRDTRSDWLPALPHRHIQHLPGVVVAGGLVVIKPREFLEAHLYLE